MSRIWKWVALITVILLVFAAALVGVAYAGGGSVGRLLATTDIADMTKFISREQLGLLEEASAKVPFGVCFQNRYNPNVEEARRMIRE